MTEYVQYADAEVGPAQVVKAETAAWMRGELVLLEETKAMMREWTVDRVILNMERLATVMASQKHLHIMDEPAVDADLTDLNYFSGYAVEPWDCPRRG